MRASIVRDADILILDAIADGSRSDADVDLSGSLTQVFNTMVEKRVEKWKVILVTFC